MRALMRGALAVALLTGTLFGFAPRAAADHVGAADCADDKKCAFPTPQDCADGNHNGNWDGGPPGRGSVCVGGGGNVGFYAGGNGPEACGVIIIANQNLTGAAVDGSDPSDWGENPNKCP